MQPLKHPDRCPNHCKRGAKRSIPAARASQCIVIRGSQIATVGLRPIAELYAMTDNSREIEAFDGLVALPLDTENLWFAGEAAISTFFREEILAMKLRALL